MTLRVESEPTVCLPDRPWLIGGNGGVCLIRVHGRPLVPVFAAAEATRAFMDRLGGGLPGHMYPLFPDESEFVELLAVAMQAGAEGYVFVAGDRRYVIEFAGVPVEPVLAVA